MVSSSFNLVQGTDLFLLHGSVVYGDIRYTDTQFLEHMHTDIVVIKMLVRLYDYKWDKKYEVKREIEGLIILRH
jgi:hypothetical protein